MKLYEYEAAELFLKKNIPYPDFKVVSNPEEAVTAADIIGLPVVLKAQVLVGGRGKAGGIRMAESLSEVKTLAEQILSINIKGERANKLMVAKAYRPQAEKYVAFILDKTHERHLLLVSSSGGIDIETSVASGSEIILKVPIDPLLELQDYHVRRAVSFLGLKNENAKTCSKIIRSLYEIYRELGCELVEINPLAVINDSELLALDAKIVIDDNAVRKYGLSFVREALGPEEEARRLGINYVELDGNIGIIGNGAGLTMATMDLVKHYGGSPANFLDIGGGANTETMFNAVSLLLKSNKVRVILVNVLGGLTKCDEVAAGIVKALNMTKTNKKIVIRLVGNREEEGRKILRDNGLEYYDSMEEAAKKAVELSIINS